MTDIAFSSARKLASMIRGKKIGCLELLNHHLARADRYNPALNAIIATQIPKARRRARAADKALAKGDIWGPLHGVPMTVKDSFDVAGLPTTWGSPDFKNNIAKTNALAVDRFLGSGAVIYGKTNVPFLLADAQSFNVMHGTTNNPWDLTRTPGGSSGGESACLATGLIAMGIGSDIASSVRNPAHFCGLYGHKPTYGICPPHGHSLIENPSPMDILDIGPLARTAGDVALGLSIISGPDEIDAVGYRLALPPPRKKKLRDFKVGIITNHPVSPVDDEVSGLLQKLAVFLGRKKVNISDKARPDIDMEEIRRNFNIMVRAATSQGQPDKLFASNIKAHEALPKGDDGIVARMLLGGTLRHRDWLKLDEARHRMRWKWHEYFKNYDLMLCPVFGSAAFRHDPTPPYERSIPVNGKQIPFNVMLFWAGYSCLTYLPATSAPIGFTKDGLPVGVQIIGPQYGDKTCLHFARLLEKEYQAFVAPPGYD